MNWNKRKMKNEIKVVNMLTPEKLFKVGGGS